MLPAFLLPVFMLTPAPEAAADEPIEVIEVRARKLRRDARDAALAVDTLKPADDPRPLTDAGALLDRAPGLRVVRTGDAGRTQTVQLRGAGGHQVAVLLDDVPLGAVRGGAVDLGAVPPAMLDRIEVVRGAAGAGYGSGAQGGVLRLRTRRFGGPAASARVRGGSFGLLQGDAAVSGRAGGLDGLAAVAGSRSTGDFAYTDAQGRAGVRRNNDHRRLSGLVRGGAEAGDWRFGLLASGLIEERGEPGRDQFPDFDARTERDEVLASVTAAHDALDARLPWRLAVWGMRRSMGYVDPTPLAADPARSEMGDARVGARIATGWEDFDRHRPTLAAQVAYETAETTGDETFGGARTTAAITGGWEAEPIDGLRLVGAVRLDASDRRSTLVVPKAGVVWSPAESLALRINGGRLFRDPGLDELYFVGQGVRGDPELRSEDGWGGDVGLTLSSGDLIGGVSLSLDAMLFAQRYDPIILFVPLDAYRVQASDDFAAAVEGVEVALRIELSWLSIEGTWLAQDPRFETAPAAALPYRPTHRLHGMMQARLHRFTPFVAGRWHGEVTIDRFGRRTQPGYGLVDAGLAVRLPAGFTVGAEVRNLLDARAVDVIQRPLPGRSAVIEVGFVAE